MDHKTAHASMVRERLPQIKKWRTPGPRIPPAFGAAILTDGLGDSRACPPGARLALLFG